MLLKVEGANPTGSFKDRGMTVAISKAAEEGAKVVVCASTGNTSASAAAYAARAGMIAAVIIPDGHVALGKLAQALIHGAKVVPVRGSFDDALHVVRELGERGGVTVVNSINPFRIEGQKTAAFEICDALGDAPDVHCIPVGNAGNITAYWKGYAEYAARRARRRSRRACSAGRPRDRRRSCSASRCRTPRRSPPRSASGTRRAGTPRSRPATSPAARSARSPTPRSSTRTGCWRRSKACSSSRRRPRRWPGLLQGAAQGLLERDEIVVCTVTGHGLKDPNRAIAEIEPRPAVDANVEQVLAELGSEPASGRIGRWTR